MKQQFEQAKIILNIFHEKGILDKLMLIGSWCLFFYKEYFKENKSQFPPNSLNLIPTVTTQDIDFLIVNQKQIKDKIDVPLILKEYDFIETFYSSGITKFQHPDIMLEFLISQKGRGDQEKVHIDELNIVAIPLRYLNFLSDYPLKMNYENMIIQIPEPTAFVLHKFIVSQRRQKNEKKDKDLQSAISLGEVLIQNKYHQNRIVQIYNEIPGSWQKTLKKILKEHSEKIYSLLN